MATLPHLRLRRLGHREYEPVWHAMQSFTDRRDEGTADELWLVEHPPVYTLGLNARPEHLLDPGGIPVVKVDRGGQVTYHGPGQIVLYTLLDLRRMGLGVREVVSCLEGAVIDLLAGYELTAEARPEAPGVYVEGAKIAALGLRIRRGCSYHGLAFNAHMDLSPFAGINPCGHPGLAVTSAGRLGIETPQEELAERLVEALAHRLGYNAPTEADGEPPVPRPGSPRP